MPPYSFRQYISDTCTYAYCRGGLCSKSVDGRNKRWLGVKKTVTRWLIQLQVWVSLAYRPYLGDIGSRICRNLKSCFGRWAEGGDHESVKLTVKLSEVLLIFSQRSILLGKCVCRSLQNVLFPSFFTRTLPVDLTGRLRYPDPLCPPFLQPLATPLSSK